MKLIMESWRKYQLNELFGNKDREKEWERIAAGGLDPDIKTVGDLTGAIETMRKMSAKGEMTAAAKKAVLDAIPWISSIKAVYDAASGAGEIIKNMYGLGDNVKTNTHLDKLNIDDNISKIVDDPIEMSFLNWLLQTRLPELPPDTPIDNFDIETELQNYLEQGFGGHAVKK
mgnify:CR=1 FL=1